MFLYAAALSLLMFVLFCIGVLRDPRRFGNAVLLGLSLTVLAVGMTVGGEVGTPRSLRLSRQLRSAAHLDCGAPSLTARYGTGVARAE